MGGGIWRATLHGVAELDATECLMLSLSVSVITCESPGSGACKLGSEGVVVGSGCPKQCTDWAA